MQTMCSRNTKRQQQHALMPRSGLHQQQRQQPASSARQQPAKQQMTAQQLMHNSNSRLVVPALLGLGVTMQSWQCSVCVARGHQ
jgi:hypothetical protein